MDPSGLTGGAREFPVTIYESTIDVVEGNMRFVFIKAPYKVETEEAERIAVDHVAKPSSSSTDSGIGSSRKVYIESIYIYKTSRLKMD
jgi:COP9 signalosome complex subunit 6